MRRFLSYCAMAVWLAGAGSAQTAPAGASFSGTVISIARETNEGVPRVRVLVRIAKPPAWAGRVIGFAEWYGLWLRSDRYRVGETIAVKLYPNSTLGLTSAATRGLRPASAEKPSARGERPAQPINSRAPARGRRD